MDWLGLGTSLKGQYLPGVPVPLPPNLRQMADPLLASPYFSVLLCEPGLPVPASSAFLLWTVNPHSDTRGGDAFLAARELLWASLEAPLPLPSPSLGASEMHKVSSTWERLSELAIGNFSLQD